MWPTFGVASKFIYRNGQELFAELDTSSREVDRLEAQRQDDKTFFEEIVADIKEALKQFKRYDPGTNLSFESSLTFL